MQHVIFSTVHNRAIDMAVQRVGGDEAVIGLYSRETLEQIAARWDGPVEVLSTEAAREREEAANITSFERVSKDRWWWLLECLPPRNWTREGDSESFAISEAYTQRVHTHCVRIRIGCKDHYFEARKRIGTPHAVLAAECRALLAQL